MSATRKALGSMSFGLAIAIFGNPATASLLTYGFSGTITSVPLELQSVLASGQSYSGTFTVDDTIVDTAIGDASVGQYPGAVLDFAVQVASSSFTAGSGTFEVFNENPAVLGDRVFVDGTAPLTGPSPAGLNLTFIRLDLNAPASAGLVTNDQIVTSASTLSSFSGRQIEFQYFTPDFQAHYGAFGTINAFVVPEPATLALLGVALAGIGFARRRK